VACRIENVTLHPADTGLSPLQEAAAQATSAVQNASWGLVTKFSATGHASTSVRAAPEELLLRRGEELLL
jgi:hypothetical protein